MLKNIHVPNSDFYEKYYAAQAGGSLPSYHGLRIQKGYGIGGILKGLYHWILPHATTAAKAVGNEALKTGIGIGQDLVSGQNMGESIKSRGANAAKSLVKRAVGSNQSGNRKQTGGGRKPTKRKPRDTSVSSPAAKRRKTTQQKKHLIF